MRSTLTGVTELFYDIARKGGVSARQAVVLSPTLQEGEVKPTEKEVLKLLQARVVGQLHLAEQAMKESRRSANAFDRHYLALNRALCFQEAIGIITGEIE